MSSITLPKDDMCSGCGACFNACKAGAIGMAEDMEGFRYPKIDKSLCMSCKACENACPVGKLKQPDKFPKAYYAYSKDTEIQKNSSSGGTFSHLAEYILSEGGVVCGVMLDRTQTVCHTYVESADELYKLRTSKYVQSDTKDIYSQAKKYLKSGRKVLFTGTPCQTAALRQFLGKDYPNLYVQDIICHGVPSPKVWREYLKETQSEKLIKSISFRDKTEGWGTYSVKFSYEDGTSFRELASRNVYIKAFLSNYSLRPSCYNCKFKGKGRVSDLTLADFWGVNFVHPELSNINGVSLVLTHSEKGEKLLSTVSDSLIIGETDCEKAIRHNMSAVISSVKPKNRDKFYDSLGSVPLDKLILKLTKPSPLRKLYRSFRSFPSRIKRKLLNR